jgi:hypothetical protein
VHRLEGRDPAPQKRQRRDVGSGGQTVATLATARRQNGATGAGAHPQTETVRLVTATVVRLERTLAHESALRVSGVYPDLFSDRVWAGLLQLRLAPPTRGNDLSRLLGGVWSLSVDMRHRSTPVRPFNGTRCAG